MLSCACVAFSRNLDRNFNAWFFFFAFQLMVDPCRKITLQRFLGIVSLENWWEMEWEANETRQDSIRHRVSFVAQWNEFFLLHFWKVNWICKWSSEYDSRSVSFFLSFLGGRSWTYLCFRSCSYQVETFDCIVIEYKRFLSPSSYIVRLEACFLQDFCFAFTVSMFFGEKFCKIENFFFGDIKHR